MERLQKKQAALRQGIEKIIAAASDLLQSPTIKVGELEERLDLLLEQADELKSVNESIEKKIYLQELDAELEACAANTEKICSIKTKIKRALRSQTANEIRSTTPSVTGNASEQEVYHIGSVSPATSQPLSATTKLPKLEIAKFSGDLRSGQKFWNQFESTIHKNSTLPAIAKFQYLTSYLTGKAAAAIEGLPISDRNYDIAVKTLIERFGKEDVIIEDHMSSLLGVRPVHDLRDIERLRTLYDEIRSGVRSLEALGVSSSTYGALLLTVLRKSIPKSEIRGIRDLRSEVPEICGDLLPPPHDSTARIAREQDLQLADTLPDGYHPGVGVELLIGADHYWDIATGNVKRLGEKLVAMETAFGWTLHGTESTSSVATFLTSTGVMRVGVTTAPDEISRQLKSFWDLEHIGIVDDAQLTTKDDSVLRAFEETITQKNGRYQVALPWKENASDLTDNKSIASHRLHSLTAKLLRHEEIILDYDQAIRNYLQAGHAEEANELGESPLGPIYYMPHRGVVRPGSETTKLRVVFDAFSKAAGKLSPNDVLFAGPNLNPNLADIVIRFRVHNVAIMSDIEKAFLQIELAESERDAVRFLWYQSTPRQGDALPPIKEYRMTRVPFGVTCSPFLLAATLSHHLKTVQEKFPHTAKILSDNLYVDDLVTGGDSVEEAERIIRESQSILKAAGMNLRKWRSNYPELIASFAETESAQKTLPELRPTKILGVEWRPDTDEFVFGMTALIGFLEERRVATIMASSTSALSRRAVRAAVREEQRSSSPPARSDASALKGPSPAPRRPVPAPRATQRQHREEATAPPAQTTVDQLVANLLLTMQAVSTMLPADHPLQTICLQAVASQQPPNQHG
ncbi:uncharacterized protein [Dermacentor albipictus]|uniref:uncharacterized protein n=1 Tax=Dermacentor albipictus TaxID=60249 RepID=UPI0038FD0D5B